MPAEVSRRAGTNSWAKGLLLSLTMPWPGYANDPEAVAAVFTEDGTFTGLINETATGRDQLMGHANTHSSDVSDSQRIGVLTPTETGAFGFRNQQRIGNEPCDFATEIELDGPPASCIVFLERIDIEELPRLHRVRSPSPGTTLSCLIRREFRRPNSDRL